MYYECVTGRCEKSSAQTFQKPRRLVAWTFEPWLVAGVKIMLGGGSELVPKWQVHNKQGEPENPKKNKQNKHIANPEKYLKDLKRWLNLLCFMYESTIYDMYTQHKGK